MAAEPTALEPITVIVPDTPAAPPPDDGIPVVAPKVAEAPPEKPVKQPKVTAETDQAVDDLRKQVEDRDRRLAEANQRAAEAAAQVQRTQAEVTTHRNAAEQARYDAIVTAHESASARMTQLETDLADATERGDFKAAAKMQGEMARLGPRLAQLEDGKAEMDEMRKNPPPPRPEVRQPPADPVERAVAGMAPRSAAWVRAHPEFVTDQSKKDDMVAAHYAALGKRLVPETDAYYADLEKTLGIGGGEADPPPVRQQREKPVGAPPTRGMVPNGVGHDNASGQRVTLTPEMRQTARALDMTDVEYAQFLQKGRADGRISH